MSLFLSTFVNKLDKKGRVSVPASFRLVLNSQDFHGIIGFRSYKFPTIEGMGIDRMKRLSESVDQLDVFSDERDDLSATIFADAQMMAFDGEGRIILPAPLIEHAELKDTVAFVGRGPTFQIWNPDLFQNHQEQARARTQEKKVSFKVRGPDA